MKKLAIFVEGQTEQIFIEKLLGEIGSKAHLTVEKHALRGGESAQRRLRNIIYSDRNNVEDKFYVLLVDSGSDNKVASDIREQYHGLANRGFNAILGLRDVYPIPEVDIPKLRQGLRYRMPTAPIQVQFILGVMEVEAWFLAEHTHFSRVHNELKTDRIKADIGIDVKSDDMQRRLKPARDLHDIYSLVGYGYNKNRARVERTVNALDFGEVYLSLSRKFIDLGNLTKSVDDFFSTTRNEPV